MKIDKEVEKIVKTAPADEQHTFVIEWDSGSLPELSGLSTRTERRQALRNATEASKEPLLSALRSASAFDVNERGGARHTVVAGSIAEWRKLFRDAAVQEAKGRILPNAVFKAD